MLKKICFVVYNNIGVTGGVNTVVLNLCNYLKDLFDISIISICKDDNFNNVKIDKVNLMNLNNDINQRLSIISLKSLFKLRKILKREKFDLIFMEGHYTPSVVLLSSIFLKKKLVFCDHGALCNQLDDKKIVLLRKLGSSFSLKTVVLTKRNLEDYNSILKVKRNKLIQIYNFCDKKFYDHAKTYNNDTKKIISVGRLSNEKGFDLAIEVSRKLFINNKDWEWHIYGDGPERKNLEDKIKEYDLQNNLILMGNTNEPYKIYRNYSIFVMPSYREGFSLTLLEAKINHLPCVSFNCASGPSDILSDGKDGFLIPCYDISEMSNKIQLLIDNPSLREKFSKNSHINLEKFDERVIMNKWKRLIEDLT